MYRLELLGILNEISNTGYTETVMFKFGTVEQRMTSLLMGLTLKSAILMFYTNLLWHAQFTKIS